MKRITGLLIAFLLVSASLASAQSQWWKTSGAHKLLVATGKNAVLNVVDTGKAGQVLISGAGTADPSWKSLVQRVVLTADTLTTGQTLVGTPLQFAVADTQSYYQFEIAIIDTSSSAAGIKIGFAIPSGASIKAQCNGETSGVTASSWDLISATATAGAAYQTQNATGGMIVVRGIVKTGSTAGTVVLQFLKVTSGTAGILAKSYLTWGKI